MIPAQRVMDTLRNRPARWLLGDKPRGKRYLEFVGMFESLYYATPSSIHHHACQDSRGPWRPEGARHLTRPLTEVRSQAMPDLHSAN
jgi:hypothetical protein